MKHKLLISSIILLSATQVDAQTFYPHINFETAQTTPLTKAFASRDTVTTNTIKWIMPGVRLGDADANDFKIDSRSARIGKLNGEVGENGCMIMAEDVFNGLHDFTFKSAMYGNHTGGQLEFAYSTNSGSTWVAADTFNIPANPNPAVFNAHYHIAGRVRFRLCKVDAGAGMINVDSIRIEELGPPPATFELSSKYPNHNERVNIQTNQLRLNYNQFVNRNTGALTIHKVGGGTQVYNIQTSPDVDLQGSSLHINNVSLDPNSTYYVTVPSGLVLSDYGSNPSNAIDSGGWVFHTYRSYFDSFTAANGGCNTIDTFDGVFKMISMSGLDRWSCESENGKGLYRMKVNPVNNSYPANEDWLVTAFPVLTTPNAVFSFDEAKDGFGTNSTRQVYYTTRFNGQINTTTWTLLRNLEFISSNNTYINRTIPLGNQNLPDSIYIAFKYTSEVNANNDPYIWKLSNIKYNANTLSVKENKQSKNIVGQVSSAKDNVQLYIDIAQAGNYTFEIVDVQGRKVEQYETYLNAGRNVNKLKSDKLNMGIYMVFIRNNNNFDAVKIMVTE